MRKTNILFISGICILFSGLLNAEEKSLIDEMKIIKKEGQEIEKDDNKVIEKYYYKKGDLKERVEIGAIADTVSIGSTLHKKHSVVANDSAKYLGQRRFWGSGLIYGANFINKKELVKVDNFNGYGIYWRFLFRKAWGIGFTIAEFSQSIDNKKFKPNEYEDMPSAWNKYRDYNYTTATSGYFYQILTEQNIRFTAPVDIRKYFFHPRWYSCYAGIGFSYFQAKYKYNLNKHEFVNIGSRLSYQNVVQEKYINSSKNAIAPVITIGMELALGPYIRIVPTGYYMYGPDIEIDGYKPLTRPLLLSLAIVGTW